MSKKLLYKTLRAYLLYSIILLLIVAPLFYFITHKLYIKNIDESLLLTKNTFLNTALSSLKEQDIATWNRFNKNSQIIKAFGQKRDSIYYANYYNKVEQEVEVYREFLAPIEIEGKPYTFRARANLIESEDLLTNIGLLFLGIILLLLVGLFIITKKLSLKLWKPFYEILGKIENFEVDKHPNAHFKNTDIEEFNRLKNSVENLINRNRIIYENQREFVENAAHELQTPVAIFKAKIDTLIQRADITQGQSEILSSLNDTISRLNRLNKNLLLLSKIDKNQFKKTETFSIQKIIKNQLIFFNEQALQKNIVFETTYKHDVTVNANNGLTEILISNLLLNAIRHNTIDGQVQINLSLKKLEISNTGSTEPLAKEKLFSRFSKSSIDALGNGLGLAIVKKIADLNNWTISYNFLENMHCFTIHF